MEDIEMYDPELSVRVNYFDNRENFYAYVYGIEDKVIFEIELNLN
jgi:hypothetical protein